MIVFPEIKNQNIRDLVRIENWAVFVFVKQVIKKVEFSTYLGNSFNWFQVQNIPPTDLKFNRVLLIG